MLAGIGATVLRERFRRNFLLVLLVIVLIVLDLLPGNLLSSALYPRAIDAWLAKQPRGYPVAFLQAGTENYKTMYGSLYHQMQIPAYNHPVHRPQAYREFQEMSANFPAAESIQQLRDYGFHYLILQHRWFREKSDGGWAEIEEILVASPELEIIADEGGFVVVEIKN
jgi:hypothetical protein